MSKVSINIKRRYILVVVIFAVLFLAGLVIFNLSGFGVQDILDYSPGNPFLAALFLVLVYCIHTVVMVIPLVLFYVAAGVLFPVKYALLVTCLGLFSELTIGYVIGYHRGASRIDHLLKDYDRARRVFGAIKKNQVISCFTARLLPLPFDLANLFFGSARMPYGSYIFFSMLGLLPGMIPFVISGKNISNPLSKEFLIPFGIGLGIALITLIIYKKISSNKKAAEPEAAGEN